jgi:2-haloacid dehalogenase
VATQQPVAFTFDIYGTRVDWRSAVIRYGTALGASRDWPSIAEAWRGLYRPTMDRVMRGELAWAPFDDLQRLMLDEVLNDVPDSDKDNLARVWSRMDAWPDVVAVSRA